MLRHCMFDSPLDPRFLRMRSPRCFERSGTSHSVIGRHMPEERRPQLYRIDSIQFRIWEYSPSNFEVSRKILCDFLQVCSKCRDVISIRISPFPLKFPSSQQSFYHSNLHRPKLNSVVEYAVSAVKSCRFDYTNSTRFARNFMNFQGFVSMYQSHQC
jgi:hypothetical protein